MKICIVTTAPVSYNPRVVKEADSLSESGFEVRVLSARHVRWVSGWDDQLMKRRRWRLEAIAWDKQGFSSFIRNTVSGARQRFFKYLSGVLTFDLGYAERGYCRLYDELLKMACRERADLYIGHNPQALPVVSAAARKMKSLSAFDFEDFHLGEAPDDEKNKLNKRLLDYLENKYVPRLDYVSASSEPIADILAKKYAIVPPVVLHNVFPWKERERLDGLRKDRRTSDLSLYWYSQIIGLDRGLQDVIRAVPFLLKPVEIHLRGRVTKEVKDQILDLAGQFSVEKRLYFHEPVHPDELLSRAAEHDVGLALETPVTQNRNLSVTNKLFFYMLAGLAVAATETAGQLSVMGKLPGVGFTYPSGDPRALAAGLNRFSEFPELLDKAKHASLEAARTVWNWETESRKLVEQARKVGN